MAFEVLYHLFAELNIGYAGVKSFRLAMDDQIFKAAGLKTKNDLEETKKRIFAKCVVAKYELENIKPHIEKVCAEYEKEFPFCLQRLEHNQKFLKGFKAMFVSSALYCIAVLFLFAHEDYFEVKDNINTTFLFLNFSILFNLFIFTRSFFDAGKDEEKTISWIYPVIMFVFLYAISFLFCYRCPIAKYNNQFVPSKFNADLSLLIAISPYLLHIIRVLFLAVSFKRDQRKVIKPIKNQLTSITKEVKLAMRIKKQSDRLERLKRSWRNP